MTTSEATDQPSGSPDGRRAPPPLDPGPLVLLGAVWDASGCRLRLRRPGEKSVLVAAAGLELNYRADVDAPRHCLGHHSPKRNDGAYLECHNPPQDGEKTCVRCAVADAEFAADLHHAHTRPADQLDGAILAHLHRTNVLYLAAFRDGSVKVGTSTESRRHVRLAEQGAWRAVEVAEVGDGFAVRHLEDLVTTELGLTQSVATSRKVRGMAAPRPDAELDRLLDRAAGQVAELLDSPAGLDAGAAAITPTGSRWSFPGGDEACWARPLRYPTAIEAGAHHLRIEAMCGRIAALVRPGGPDHFVADLGRLWGREIDLGDHRPDELMVQDTLF